MRGDKAGKDLFKLFNNAVFGKIMETLRNQINFEVVTLKDCIETDCKAEF